VLHPGPIIDVMENYCRTLPEPAQDACIQFVNTYGRPVGARPLPPAHAPAAHALFAGLSGRAAPLGEVILEGWVARNTADMICRSIGICTDPTCNLFPLPPAGVQQIEWKGREKALASGYRFAPCDLPVISDWCKSLEDFIEIHTPLFDKDKDRHSTFPTLRGTRRAAKTTNETRLVH